MDVQEVGLDNRGIAIQRERFERDPLGNKDPLGLHFRLLCWRVSWSKQFLRMSQSLGSKVGVRTGWSGKAQLWGVLKGRGPGAQQQGLLGREESEVTLVCLSLKFLILKMFIFLCNNKRQNFGIGPVLLGLQPFSSAYSIISKRYPVLGFLQWKYQL